MDGLSVQAQEARRNYKRQYRIQNREKINAQQREWRANHPAEVQEYQRRYWEKQAEKRNIRASWRDYNITQERVGELVETVRMGKCDAVVFSAAQMADEKAAGHIILSVAQDISYDRLEYHDKLGRCPLGRTSFYGVRRLFFHYLDCAMKEGQAGDCMEAGNG